MYTESKRDIICSRTGRTGVENEIIVLLTDGGLNRECCHGNKMFYILQLLSSRFISVPSFT